MPEVIENFLVDEKVDIKLNGFDVNRVRRDFPILSLKVHGRPLVYLDNAATTQKPKAVIDAITNYYVCQNSNVHRGVHYLSETATQVYEDARLKVKDFINANSEKEIIFVKGTTEGINLVASSYGSRFFTEGDEIIISTMEHHSNIVPWQLLCEAKGAKLRIAPISDAGEIILEEYEKLLNERTKLVAVVYYSNSLGTINPIKKMAEMAHAVDAKVLIDGAQAMAHKPIDVQELDCDFYAFSAHKMFGPTGMGVLYGKEELLEEMPPYQGGGDMIKSVSFEKTTYNDLPNKFEAGTPNVAGAVGLGKAVDYLLSVGYENIAAHEAEVTEYAEEALQSINKLKIIGTASHKTSVISFVLEGVHPHDVGTILDRYGIAVRTGHHCTQPVMERFNVPATSRASFALYNIKEEVDKLVDGIHKVVQMFN